MNRKECIDYIKSWLCDEYALNSTDREVLQYCRHIMIVIGNAMSRIEYEADCQDEKVNADVAKGMYSALEILKRFIGDIE